MEQKTNNQQPEVIHFDYEGNPVSFSMGSTLMVNATEMAKTFNKRVPEWTRLQSTKDFLDELWTFRSNGESGVQKMHYDIEKYNDEGLTHILKCLDKDLHLIITSSGGKNQGTWMHRDVAIEFARWLNPKFAIWCNDRIFELLTKGHTSIPDKDSMLSKLTPVEFNIFESMKSMEKEIHELQFWREYFESSINSMQIDIDFFSRVLHGSELYDVYSKYKSNVEFLKEVVEERKKLIDFLEEKVKAKNTEIEMKQKEIDSLLKQLLEAKKQIIELLEGKHS